MSKYAPAATGTYNLNGSIGSTDSSFTLSSFTDPTTGVAITMTTLNTDIGYGTIGPRTSSFELISFTGITQNADGTATITGVTRGLSRQSPFTTNSAYKLPHSGQSIFILSDAPQVFAKYVSLENAETITGLKTFPGGGDASAPVSGTVYAAPTNPLEYASMQYVLNTATGTTQVNGILVSGTAGANLTAGWVVYQKTSDGKWYKVLANDTSTFQGQELGIAQSTVSSGGSINVLIRGIDSNQSGLGAGTAYYATDAGGLPSSSPGTNVVFVGYGTTTATKLLVDFRSIDIPYHGEKLALVGDNTDIVVGTGNKFVTQTGLQKTAEVYAASSAGTDTYAITLSPIPTSYTNGMTLRFKTDVGNTGAATLNVNSLGAVNLVTSVGTALVTGDIAANQIVQVIYNSTGPVFEVVNPASAVLSRMVAATGNTTHDMTSTTTTTIAHGLGVTPKLIRITMNQTAASAGAVATSIPASIGTFDGSTQNSIFSAFSSNGSLFGSGIDTSNIIHWARSAAASATTDFLVGNAAIDATNITITWTKTNSPTGTGNIIWEALA